MKIFHLNCFFMKRHKKKASAWEYNKFFGAFAYGKQNFFSQLFEKNENQIKFYEI